ncbi:MAG: hypothetical protein EOP50_00385 [Sphingobacteriales bacterium]|nr:MAG: hypothetical protein EOP50_00385 [Sphingobacteriales bacterium]
MSKHYTIRSFFRQMPNALLARYFEAKGIEHGLDIAKLPETKPEPWMDVWAYVPDGKRSEMEADFRDIHAMSSEGGTLAIMDELRWLSRPNAEDATAIIEKLSALTNHAERAMMTFLDHGECWRGATRFQHADTLSNWRKRNHLGHKAAAVDDASIQQLSDLIRGYFHHTEGRGKHCTVEPLRRGNRDYFFAYPEDHSQRSVEWVDGEFSPRPHNPAFEIVFVYSQAQGALDISYRGSKKAVEALQGIFAQAILKLDALPPDPKDARVYDLAPLSQKSFEFKPSPASGIEKVVVKRIRMSSAAKQGDRITLEADTKNDRHAVYALMEQIKRAMPLHLYNVTQVELTASVSVDPDKPPKNVNIRISHPNLCSLKYDELDLKLRDMLVASGIEPQLPPEDAEPTVEDGSKPAVTGDVTA